MQLHQFCPVFQLRGGDSRKLFHIYGMLGFMLQKRNKKPLAFKIIRLLNAVDCAIGRGPAARTVPAEGQIIHPASEYEAFENVNGVFRRSARQFDLKWCRNAVALAAETDLAMKSTGIDREELLTDLLLKLAAG